MKNEVFITKETQEFLDKGVCPVCGANLNYLHPHRVQLSIDEVVVEYRCSACDSSHDLHFTPTDFKRDETELPIEEMRHKVAEHIADGWRDDVLSYDDNEIIRLYNKHRENMI